MFEPINLDLLDAGFRKCDPCLEFSGAVAALALDHGNTGSIYQARFSNRYPHCAA
jgi:hypothetical protein